MLCGMCGQSYPAGAVTCGRCGAQLAPAGAGQPAEPPPGYGVPPGYGAGFSVPAGYAAGHRWRQRAWHQLTGLSTWLVVALGFSALSALTRLFIGALLVGLVLGLAQLATAVLFLVWFYRARGNAGWSDWRQRLAPAWAIWGWFVPVIFLWFPVQVMAGIWRAGQAPAARAKPMVLVAMWWSCWLLAWFTGYRHTTTTTVGGPGVTNVSVAFGLYFEGTTASKLFAAAAAVLLAVIVRQVSAGPLGVDGPPR